MKKEQVLARMKEDCLVAVVRAKNYEQGEKVVDAIIEGGINFIELTMTMDEGDPVEFIKMMANKYKGNDKIVIGAGTVLDPETARAWPECGYHQAVQPLQGAHAPGGHDPNRSNHCTGSRMRYHQGIPGQYCGTGSYQLLQGTSSTGRVHAVRRC